MKLFKLSKTTRAVAGHTFEDIELEDIDVPGKFFLGEVAIETNSVKILKDLADGQYFLRVTAIVTTDDRDEKAISAPALGFTSNDDGYFTVAGIATKK